MYTVFCFNSVNLFIVLLKRKAAAFEMLRINLLSTGVGLLEHNALHTIVTTLLSCAVQIY